MKNTRNLLFFFPGLLFALLIGCANNQSDDRPLNPVGHSSPTDSVALELFAEGFTNPVAMEEGPDGHFYIVDQTGLIRVVDSAGTVAPTPFLDLRESIVDLKNEHDERGLLGLALHPDFASNGRFYVHYSAPLRPGGPQGWSHTKHLSEFTVNADDPLQADPESERILMRVDEPQTNHNGGTLTFGPDGYLYLGLGDGGGANDTGTGHLPDWYERNDGGNGQEQSENLLGSIIRIDVDGEAPYGIPEDNFLADREGVREMYATGLRNPYRFSFDRGGDGALYVADVGQKLWEEINIVEAGGNYGWNVKEGFECFNAAEATEPLSDCPSETAEGEPLIDPILVFPHKDTLDYTAYGIAVIGGYVYRGGHFPDLNGSYVFGMWTQHHGTPAGAVYAAQRTGDEWEVSELFIRNAAEGKAGRYVNGFAEDRSGELYVLTSENEAPVGQTGKVYRLVPDSDYAYEASGDYTPGGKDEHGSHNH